MRQTRLSIGCQDWQETVRALGATAAAVYLYLRTLMRSMQAAKITITASELAEAVKIPADAAESALQAILAAGYFTATQRGTEITLVCREEAKAQADMFRKRAARLLSRQVGQSGDADSPHGQSGRAHPAPIKSAAPRADGPSGQSGVLSATSQDLSVKQYETDFFMIYRGQPEEKEKAPHTPEKEKTLTEFIAPASMRTREREPELPADSLEADYIDVIGSWPDSLRKAIRAEKEDIREAFYLCLRKRQADEGRAWSGDQIRMTWLAARRIPEERRAESILAWGMGGWKTIRDAGSGCYFEKDTGRVVSLVRGTVETRSAPIDKQNTDLAARLARNMRRD